MGSGTNGSSPARLRTASTSRFASARCNWPVIEPLEVNPNACSHAPTRGASLSLTAPERETVITFSDADETATVHTHQRRIITKLRNNPAATKVDDLTFEGSAGAVFEIPAELISFRSGRRKLSPEQARAAVANLDQTRQAA
jgi:hypothetical protein